MCWHSLAYVLVHYKTLWKSLVWKGRPPTPHFETRMGYRSPLLINFEKNRQSFLPPPPAMPLSRSCQTPNVINPSAIRTTAVVLRSSIINCSLIMALSSQLWFTNSWCVSAGGWGGGGGNGPLTKATCNGLRINRSGGENKSHFQNWGIYCPNERFTSWMIWQ